MDKKNNIEDDLDALSPEEIKAIGEIEIGPSKQDQFLNKHYKKLIAGGVVLMVAISTGICIATFHQQHKDAGAAALVDVAGVTVPGEAATPAAYDAKAIERVCTEYAGTDSAVTARLMEGLSLLTSESSAEKGVAVLEEVAATSGNDLLTARALAALAMHYTGHISAANQEEGVKKAQEAWKRVTQLPFNAYTALAYITLGDMAQSAGDKEGARTYYNLLAKECPNSTFTANGLTMLRQMLLDTDNPIPVEPLPETPTTQPLLVPGSNPFGTSGSTGTDLFGTGSSTPSPLLPTAPSPTLPLPEPAQN